MNMVIIPIPSSHNRNMFLLWCGFCYLNIIVARMDVDSIGTQAKNVFWAIARIFVFIVCFVSEDALYYVATHPHSRKYC
jgi:hypothetical protein